MLADDDLGAAKTPAGVFHDRECLGQDFAQPTGKCLIVLNLGDLLFPGSGLLAQGVVGDLLQFGLKGVDLRDQGTEALDLRSFFEPMNFFTMYPIMIDSTTPRRYGNPSRASKI